MKVATGGDYQLAPEGTHDARFCSVVDIGMQESNFQGKTKTNPQAIVGLELVDTKMEDGSPFVMSKFYTISLDDRSNLHKDFKSLAGKKFTEERLAELANNALKPLLDKPLQVVIGHEMKGDKEKAVIKLMMPSANPDAVTPLSRPVEFFDMDDADMGVFNGLPDWKKTYIDQTQCVIATGGEEDDIPF